MGKQRYHSLDPAVAAPATEPGGDGGSEVYFLYRDAEGNAHIVDHRDEVPKGTRHVQRMLVPRDRRGDDDGAPHPGSPLPPSEPNADSAPPAVRLPNTLRPLAEQMQQAAAAAGIRPLPASVLGWLPLAVVLGAMVMTAMLFSQLRGPLLRGALCLLGLTYLGSILVEHAAQRAGLAGPGHTPATSIAAARQEILAAQRELVREADQVDRIR